MSYRFTYCYLFLRVIVLISDFHIRCSKLVKYLKWSLLHTWLLQEHFQRIVAFEDIPNKYRIILQCSCLIEVQQVPQNFEIQCIILLLKGYIRYVLQDCNGSGFQFEETAKVFTVVLSCLPFRIFTVFADCDEGIVVPTLAIYFHVRILSQAIDTDQKTVWILILRLLFFGPGSRRFFLYRHNTGLIDLLSHCIVNVFCLSGFPKNFAITVSTEGR